MQLSEIYIALILTTIIILVFTLGIIIFILQYRKRKMEYKLEKDILTKSHQEELLKTQIDIQVQTMKDIGREIHDNVGQKLTLASIYTGQLAHSSSNLEIQGKLNSIGAIINESLSELRSLSKSITNELIDSYELIQLLDNECARLRALNMCTVHFYHTNQKFQLSAIQKNFIHRIVQEFFQNSLKHSSCKQISINLSLIDNCLDLNLIDDGIGFDLQKSFEGIGLKNIKSRADLLNAFCSFNSEVGKGTQLNIKLTLNI